MVDITIIIPTKNEEECIEEMINKTAQELEKTKATYEILIIDDKSMDRTREITNEIAQKNNNVKFVMHQPPHSFGCAIRDGIQMAKGKMTVIMMADLSDDPIYLPEMWKKFNEGYDLVCGSRFLPDSNLHSYPLIKMLSNRLFNYAIAFSLLQNLSDSSNNFKAYNTEKAKNIKLESKGFEAGAELYLKMLISGEKAIEIPVSWTDRTLGNAKFKLSRVFYNYFFLYLKIIKAAYIDKLVKT